MKLINTVMLALALAISAGAQASGNNNNSGGPSCRGNANCSGGTPTPQSYPQPDINVGAGAIAGAAAGAISSSEANASAGAVAAQLQGQQQQQGQTVNVDNASGGGSGYGAAGDSSVTIGDTLVEASDSSVTLQAGALRAADAISTTSDVTIEGDDYDLPKPSAASAASIYSAYCVNGASAQVASGGGAISNQDVLCDHLKVADAMLVAYQRQLEWCEERCVTDFVDGLEKGSTTPPVKTCSVSTACDPASRDRFLEAYNENMDDVRRIMAQTSATGQVSKTAGQLVIPTIVVGAISCLLGACVIF